MTNNKCDMKFLNRMKIGVYAPYSETGRNNEFKVVHNRSGKLLTVNMFNDAINRLSTHQASDCFIGRNKEGAQGATQESHKRLQRHAAPAAFALTSCLRDAGYDALMYGSICEGSMKRMLEEGVSIFCISSSFLFCKSEVVEIIQLIRKRIPNAIIIVGGLFVWKSFLTEQKQDCLPLSSNEIENIDTQWLLFPSSMQEIGADVFVVAQDGLETLLKILPTIIDGKMSELSECCNLAVPGEEGRYEFTPQKPERMAFQIEMKWDLVDVIPYSISVRNAVGCPYKCNYCDFIKLFDKVSFRSPESLVRELVTLRDAIGTNARNEYHIMFADENLLMGRKQIESLSNSVIESGINLDWHAFVRADAINDENIKLIKKSGATIFRIGAESGDNAQLKHMNKNETAEQMKASIELASSHGIHTQLSFVVGFPGETAESVEKTKFFISNLKKTRGMITYATFPLFLMPLSNLATNEMRDKWGLSGMFGDWSHKTMNSQKAVEHSEAFFTDVDNIYPEHSDIPNQVDGISPERLFTFQRQRHNLSLQLLKGVDDRVIVESIWEMARSLRPGLEFKDRSFQAILLAGFARELKITGRGDRLRRKEIPALKK